MAAQDDEALGGDETQIRLLDWRQGQTPSEYLAALILDAEGYTDIDPSHPLGGPDGGRDGHCTTNGEPWTWAVCCGTDTDTTAGTATSAAPSTFASSGAVDVSALDVGKCPTTPQPPLGAAGTEFKGKLADARRMADFVIGPWDVDTSLIGAYATSASVLKGPDALELIAPRASPTPRQSSPSSTASSPHDRMSRPPN